MQRWATVEDVDVMVGLEAFAHQDVEGDLRTRVHLAHGFLGFVRQQWHVDRVVRHQLGEERTAFQSAQALGGGVVEVEEVATDGVPERRITVLVAVADDLGHHRVGKALGVAGDEQQAATGVEFRPRRTDQRRLHVETGEQAVAGQVVALGKHVDLVVDLQLAGGVHEGFVTEAVERLRVTGRGDDGRAAGELAGLGVFEHKEVALFTVETHLGREGGFAGGDFIAQALHIVRQGGDTNRAVRSQTLYLAQISHLRGAHHQHGVTP
ncbi:hypothetical protein PS720_06485 [Pseudomonas fluorescens]|nr:hypothetical protein PS720_06485 [Pseudomonas fluorescens]